MFKVLSGGRGQKLGLCVSVVSALGLGACATTNTPKSVQAAPITYKLDQEHVRDASTPLREIARPYSPPSRSASHPQSVPQSVPYRATPVTPAPAPVPAVPQASIPADNFDASAIDRTLYKHQKVGKRYTVLGKSYTPQHNPDYDVIGTASWYGDKFHGKPTATGEVYDKNDITAAHKTLPLNSWARVTNLENGKVLTVRLNDRGPFIGDRIIDLSEASARILGTLDHGLGRVRVQYAGPADAPPAHKMYKNVNPTVPQTAPVTPQPAPAPQVQNAPIAQAPQSVTPATPVPEYRPLREAYGGEAQTQEQRPYIPPVAEMPVTPQIQEYTPLPEYRPEPAPQVAMPAPANPQDIPPLPDDGTVTLTIKGPVHMATTRSEVKVDTNPRFIPAVNKIEIKK